METAAASGAGMVVVVVVMADFFIREINHSRKIMDLYANLLGRKERETKKKKEKGEKESKKTSVADRTKQREKKK